MGLIRDVPLPFKSEDSEPSLLRRVTGNKLVSLSMTLTSDTTLINHVHHLRDCNVFGGHLYNAVEFIKYLLGVFSLTLD